MSATLFRDVMIFDDSGDALFPGEMMLRGETIEAVARGDERIDSAGAEVIDGGGRTLRSGMVEAHAHLTWPSSIKRVINAMKVPLDKHVAITERNARTTLHAGFTSAYSAGSLGETIEPALRDRIDAGLIPELLLRASALERGAMGVMGCERAKRGIRVLPGGDYVSPYNPIGRNARDLAIFVDLFGFTPSEALVASTRHGGALMDMTRTTGVPAPGAGRRAKKLCGGRRIADSFMAILRLRPAQPSRFNVHVSIRSGSSGARLMNFDLAAGAVVALIILVYLTAVLARPEQF